MVIFNNGTSDRHQALLQILFLGSHYDNIDRVQVCTCWGVKV